MDTITTNNYNKSFFSSNVQKIKNILKKILAKSLRFLKSNNSKCNFPVFYNRKMPLKKNTYIIYLYKYTD